MSDKKDAKAAEAAPKKSPMMMIVIVVAVIAMAAMFVVGKQVSAKGNKTEEKKKVEHGPTMTLDEFLVNLADNDGDHFLKVTVGLGLDKGKGKTPESLKEETSMIRDAVLTSLSSKMRADVSTGEGREKLKADIKKKVNTALGEDDVDDVYFSNFVTQ